MLHVAWGHSAHSWGTASVHGETDGAPRISWPWVRVGEQEGAMEMQRPRAPDPTNTSPPQLGQPSPPGPHAGRPGCGYVCGRCPEISYENPDFPASPIKLGHTLATHSDGAHWVQLARPHPASLPLTPDQDPQPLGWWRGQRQLPLSGSRGRSTPRGDPSGGGSCNDRGGGRAFAGNTSPWWPRVSTTPGRADPRRDPKTSLGGSALGGAAWAQPAHTPSPQGAPDRLSQRHLLPVLDAKWGFISSFFLNLLT